MTAIKEKSLGEKRLIRAEAALSRLEVIRQIGLSRQDLISFLFETPGAERLMQLLNQPVDQRSAHGMLLAARNTIEKSKIEELPIFMAALLALVPETGMLGAKRRHAKVAKARMKLFDDVLGNGGLNGNEK